MQNIYQFLSYIIFGIIFNIILKKFLNKNNRNEDNSITRIKTRSSNLIYNDSLKFSKKNILSFIIICSIYAFYIIIMDILRFFKYNNLNIWTFHLAFVLIFMNCYFPQNLYKHQIYPMIFVIFFCTIFLILSTFLDFKDGKNIYQVKGTGLCISIIFTYIILVLLFSFSEIKIKVFIDLKYLSPYTIIISIGIIGFIATFIASLIFGLNGKECNKQLEYDINCYFEILPYLNRLKTEYNSEKKNFYLEIFLITPLFLFIEFLYMTFTIFIFKYLNPCYHLFSDNIYYLIYYLFTFIYGLINASDYIFPSIIGEIPELFEFIVFCIYLEIIELRFCGLNKNTRKNIILRAEFDSEGEINNNESFNEGHNIIDNDEEDTNNNELQLFNLK